MTGPSLQADEALTLVTLSLGRQVMAIPATMLREILDPLPVTRVPGAGPQVPGVVNVRGSVVPLADLKQVLGIPERGEEQDEDRRRRFLTLDVPIAGEPTLVAIAADAVHEVTVVRRTAIEPVPAAATDWPPGFLSGLYRASQGFVLLPDLEVIFTKLAGRPLAATA